MESEHGNTALKGFARRNAFLLHIPSRWEEPRYIFQLQSQDKIHLCHSVVKFFYARDDLCPGTMRIYVCSAKMLWLHLGPILSEHPESATWPQGELKQALHTFRTELKWRNSPSKLLKAAPQFSREHHFTTAHPSQPWVPVQSNLPQQITASSTQQFGCFK